MNYDAIEDRYSRQRRDNNQLSTINNPPSADLACYNNLPMVCQKRFIKISGFVFLLYFVFPVRASAYLDPGTGSYIIQVLIAAVAGGTYLIFTSWGKIKELLAKLMSKLQEGKEDAQLH